ncbi:hypothetical protein CK203_061916 [Vitis vinifera]|uniref:Reverse transcriptase domain-containing protein n=1 Tax=Vitis vinifera TaxID=29760 RepID=A0A438GCK1_VITVI|nr:hypothetical protein CK203_061916 [Vitis vinifera]
MERRGVGWVFQSFEGRLWGWPLGRRSRVGGRSFNKRVGFRVKAFRGLRQGDSLSPFLFTIVVDVLSGLIMRVEERGVFEGFWLRINLNKSTLFRINISQSQIARLASLLDCAVSDWPLLYLGLPLGGNPNSISFWDLVLDSPVGGWMDEKSLLILRW